MKTRSKGATLPELLVCMSIMGVLLFLAARLVTHAYEFYRFTDESISLQREGIFALQAITSDLTLSHQRSVVSTVQNVPTPAPTHREDLVVIPLPQGIDGGTTVTEEGSSMWMSVAGYEIDTSRPTRNLMRYLGDTIHDPDTDGSGGGDFVPEPPVTDPYVGDIETVKIENIPTVAEIKLFPAVGLRAKSICRNVLEFKVHRSTDVVEVDITILLTGRVQGATSLDNSINLKTTILPRN